MTGMWSCEGHVTCSHSCGGHVTAMWSCDGHVTCSHSCGGHVTGMWSCESHVTCSHSSSKACSSATVIFVAVWLKK